MNFRIKIIAVIVTSLVVVGCSHQLTFKELTKDLPNPKTRNYSSEKMNYTFDCLENIVHKETVDDSAYQEELFLDTTHSFMDGTSIMGVIKYSSNETSLIQVWNGIVSNRPPDKSIKIYATGNTQFLSRPAYYEHSGQVISDKKRESINFIMHGDSSNFYVVSLGVNREEGYPENMKELLYCAKSLKFK